MLLLIKKVNGIQKTLDALKINYIYHWIIKHVKPLWHPIRSDVSAHNKQASSISLFERLNLRDWGGFTYSGSHSSRSLSTGDVSSVALSLFPWGRSTNQSHLAHMFAHPSISLSPQTTPRRKCKWPTSHLCLHHWPIWHTHTHIFVLSGHKQDRYWLTVYWRLILLTRQGCIDLSHTHTHTHTHTHIQLMRLYIWSWWFHVCID